MIGYAGGADRPVSDPYLHHIEGWPAKLNAHHQTSPVILWKHRDYVRLLEGDPNVFTINRMSFLRKMILKDFGQEYIIHPVLFCSQAGQTRSVLTTSLPLHPGTPRAGSSIPMWPYLQALDRAVWSSSSSSLCWWFCCWNTRGDTENTLHSTPPPSRSARWLPPRGEAIIMVLNPVTLSSH